MKTKLGPENAIDILVRSDLYRSLPETKKLIIERIKSGAPLGFIVSNNSNGQPLSMYIDIFLSANEGMDLEFILALENYIYKKVADGGNYFPAVSLLASALGSKSINTEKKENIDVLMRLIEFSITSPRQHYFSGPINRYVFSKEYWEKKTDLLKFAKVEKSGPISRFKKYLNNKEMSVSMKNEVSNKSVTYLSLVEAIQEKGSFFKEKNSQKSMSCASSLGKAG